jgi:CRISPR-associated endonuclease/helicase Cas3
LNHPGAVTRIYAKSADETGYKEPLAEHTIHDIQAGRRLISNLPFSYWKKRRIAHDLTEAIAFHDIGKAATGFQISLDTRKPWGHRHEILSAAAATAAGLSDAVVFAVLMHHKTLPPDIATVVGCLPDEEIPYLNNMSNERWQEMAKQWYANLDLFAYEWRMICEYIRRPDLLSTKLSLAQLSDSMTRWLQRDTQAEHFPYKQREYVSLLRGLIMSADHIASAINLEKNSRNLIPIIPKLSEPKYSVMPPNTEPHGFQLAASKNRGNLILRAPTGSGKTEAALLWAQLNQGRNGRLFYALPTTASINAMYLRMKECFKDKDNRLVGLLHSRTVSSLYSMFEREVTSQYHDSMANQAIARTIGSLVREMYFPIRVCTPHQILRYTLQGKGWEAMLSEFPHSVFVFDEIHAYNPKLTGLTLATAYYLTAHKATVMFLTATLPTFLRKLIEREIPLVDFIQPSYANASDKLILEQKRHTVEAVPGNILMESSIGMIAREAAKARSTLVVCNHVVTAQQVYRALKDNDAVLLHSRFTRRDRNSMENELLRSKRKPDDPLYKRLPKILVATQVVEVSLDLEFEQGFIEPAAIDALVQRMGRINRYASQPRPAKIRIFTEQYSPDNRIYSKELRNDSLKVLTGLPMPLSEEDLNAAADDVYGSGYNADDQAKYKQGLDYEQLKEFKRCLVAGTSENWIDVAIEKNEGTVELLPEPLAAQYDALKQDHLTVAANDLLVPVGIWLIPGLVKYGRLDTEQDPWKLSGCRYSKQMGLEIDTNGERSSYVAI